MSSKQKKIALIGSGKVATSLALMINSSVHYQLIHIYSRNKEHAKQLVSQLRDDIFCSDSLSSLPIDADIYLFAVSDDALEHLLPNVPKNETTLWIHTSGALSLSLITNWHPYAAVMYPLQTFSLGRSIFPKTLPFYLEGSSAKALQEVELLARSLSSKIYFASSEQRLILHIAAVFSSNFVNHLLHLSYDLLKWHQLPEESLKDLIKETIDKALSMGPRSAQTGPALRKDEKTLKKHIQELEKYLHLKKIYQDLTASIQDYTTPTLESKTMSNISYDLKRIKAFIFDVDGVLSLPVSAMDQNGRPLRTMNVRDGYAIQYAIKQGFVVGIISGGIGEDIKNRAIYLGIEHLYMKVPDKTKALDDFLQKTRLKEEEILYVGDDIPDIPIMRLVGLPVAPKDAVVEVKAIAQYISHIKGGEGVARDVIEQTLKAQGLWAIGNAFGW